MAQAPGILLKNLAVFEGVLGRPVKCRCFMTCLLVVKVSLFNFKCADILADRIKSVKCNFGKMLYNGLYKGKLSISIFKTPPFFKGGLRGILFRA